ncbi:conserved hypothetical protein [Chthoniobacter flavus Ellin428]|uniref:G domain-containing protein n=1 Tax=Chthoniobacter flavus Ellin428 TaxID=497964 RepID=B4CZB0_9BACT|nr:DUF697 domain-containing protein [Chthoniobacter flavus]EDY20801.1 conserved hypothetical protein [Chthoniobacter flavus Ellin428]TCO89694.1 uncharacterized protein (DUF697 family) [Chthoniobacter flavus]
MKPSSFLPLYEKLEALVNKLPAGLQQPILREITPIKTLFLMQRPPRLVLVGPNGAGKAELLATLFGDEVFRPGEENLSDGHWQTIDRTGRGSLRLLDARRPASLPLLREVLTQEPPDLFIFARSAGPIGDSLSADLDHAVQLLPVVTPREGAVPKLMGLLLPGDGGEIEAARQELHAVLHTRPELSARMAGTLALFGDPVGQRLAELIAIELPPAAQLEMARLSSNRALQKQIAQVVIKSVTAICTAIGAQPIPLADFPILTSLQATMVAGIMHISGREMSARLAAEFMTAVGANVGLGLALREGARAAVKFLPGWGNAISGAVAGAGTYSIGHAAVSYFIEGVSLKDARSVFKRGKKEPTLLKE